MGIVFKKNTVNSIEIIIRNIAAAVYSVWILKLSLATDDGSRLVIKFDKTDKNETRNFTAMRSRRPKVRRFPYRFSIIYSYLYVRVFHLLRDRTVIYGPLTSIWNAPDVFSRKRQFNYLCEH